MTLSTDQHPTDQHPADQPPADQHSADLDARDPLASHRDRFVGAEGPLVYLDGNSLGRPLRVTGERLHRFVDEEWGGRLIRGWDERWMQLPLAVGDRIGAATLGAATGQTAVGDSTTVLLYKTMRAAVAARPGRTEIVLDRDQFPTDRYVADGVARECGLTLLGLSCPGCGGLRAVNDLTHGDVVAAASSNLALVVALPFLVAGLAVWTLDRWRGTRTRLPAGVARLGARGALVALALFTVLRNLPAGSWLAP